MSPISRIFSTHHVAQLAGNVKEPTPLSKKVWCCCLTCWCFSQDTPHCTFPPWIELSKKNCYDDDYVLLFILEQLHGYRDISLYCFTIFFFFYPLTVCFESEFLQKFYFSIVLPLHNMCILTCNRQALSDAKRAVYLNPEWEKVSCTGCTLEIL